jgi:hypothetical protein
LPVAVKIEIIKLSENKAIDQNTIESHRVYAAYPFLRMPLAHTGKVLIRLIKRSDKIPEIAATPYWIKRHARASWERYTEYDQEQ